VRKLKGIFKVTGCQAATSIKEGQDTIKWGRSVIVVTDIQVT
jgi:hypothetical protein